MKDEFLLKMRNILLSYSIRNITVGYCQGMNFLVARLLLVIENEEEVFWIFVQIIENFLSLLNYQEITGVIIETTLIETLISYYLPELNSFLKKKDFTMSLSNFIHKWIIRNVEAETYDEAVNRQIAEVRGKAGAHTFDELTATLDQWTM